MPFTKGHKISVGNKYAVRKKPLSAYYKVSKNGCWEWLHAIVPSGYAYFWWKGKTRRAARVFYEIRYGKIGKNKQIDHLCRNRRCVNPRHLESVSAKENIRRSRLTTLTYEKVRKIKKLSKTKLQREIAEMFDVDPSTISRILNGRRWL